MASAAERHVCDIVIVGGHLGAGKTSFLLQILEKAGDLAKERDLHIAVIQNEVRDEISNDSSPEAPLLLGDTSFSSEADVFERVQQLPTGCICCSVRTELSKAITILSKMTIASSGQRVNTIVVEAAGTADLGACYRQIAGAGQLEAADQEGILLRVSKIIAVVDMTAMTECCSQGSSIIVDKSVQAQVAVADVVICNKADRLPSASVSLICKTFRAHNPSLESVNVVSLKRSLNSVSATDLANWLTPAANTIVGLERMHNYSGGPINDHEQVTSVELKVPFGSHDVIMITSEKVERILGELLWEESDRDQKILRCKGYFVEQNIKQQGETDRPELKISFVNTVGQELDIEEARSNMSQFSNVNHALHLLFIGVNLQRPRLLTLFNKKE